MAGGGSGLIAVKLEAVAFDSFAQTSHLRLGFGLSGTGNRHAIGQQQIASKVGPPELAPPRGGDGKARPASRFLAALDNPAQRINVFTQNGGFLSVRAADRTLRPPCYRMALDVKRSHVDGADLPI